METRGTIWSKSGTSRDTILSVLALCSLCKQFPLGVCVQQFWHYGGGGAAAKAAGMSWEDAAQKELYEPLSMTSDQLALF